jgi:hypothetical protein
MAIIKQAELHYVKCDPKRPNAKFNKKNPTWECQIRTTEKGVAKAWEEMNLPVKAVIPDEGPAYWRVNLRKKSIKEADGEKSNPVEVLDGHKKPLDPNTIGHGSVGNVRVYQYEYKKEGGGKGVTSVLMGIQVTKLLEYEPTARDDEFEEAEMEVVKATPRENDEDDDDDGDYDDEVTSKAPSMTPKKAVAGF